MKIRQKSTIIYQRRVQGRIMAKKANEFLSEYYERLLFNNMRIEQFAKFCDYVKRNDMSGNMKNWANDLLEHDPNNPDVLLQDASGLYIRKPNLELIDEWNLDKDELVKLFKAIQNTFRSMDANKSEFKKDDKVNNFLNSWFGNDGQLFKYAKINPAFSDQIDRLKQIANDPNNAGVLEWAFSNHFDDDFSFKDFKEGLDKEKYNTDPKFQKRLTRFVNDFNNTLEYSRYGNERAEALIKNGITEPFENVDKWFDDDIHITDRDLGEFRGRLTDLLSELNSNENAFKVFSANDNSKISKSLTDAREYLDYNNKESKNYVPAERKDKLTPWQQFSDRVKQTYSDYLQKYVELRGDRVFFSPQAKLMVKAVDSCKIKPTDGLDKILSEKDKITSLLRGKYSSPKAAGQFEWFAKKMDELKTAMPKAFEGALRNGEQMRTIVAELIADAIDEGKIDEAKSAMEFLTVVKYGLTTSRIMDNIAKNPLTLFSDKSLSWNKNDGMKFVTKVMDNAINSGIKIIGRGITMGVNAVRQKRRSQFNRYLPGRLAEKHREWQTKHDAELDRRNAFNAAQEQTDNSLRTNAENTLNQLARDGLTEATKDAEQQALNNERMAAEPLKNNLDNAKKRQDAAETTLKQQQDFDKLSQYIQTLQKKHNRTEYEDMQLQYMTEQYKELQDAVAQEHGWDAFDQQLFDTEVNDARNTYPQINQAVIDAQEQYDTKHSEIEKREKKLQEFTDATQALKEIDARAERRQKADADWNKKNNDKFQELMAFWDKINSGSITHTGKMYSWRLGSAKVAQKRFDEKIDSGKRDENGNPIMKPRKQLMFDKYLSDYQI